MSREPEIVLTEIKEISETIDLIYGDKPRPVAFIPPPPGHVRILDGVPWKGRKSATPLNYDTAVTIQLHQRDRAVLRAELPPLALMQQPLREAA